MKKLFILPALLSVPLCFSASTFGQTTPPSYDYVQLGAVQTDFADIPEFDAKGFQLKASKELGYNLFAEAMYFDASDEASNAEFDFDFDVEKWEISLGYIHRFSAATALDAQVGYGDIELGLSNGQESASTGTNYYMLETNIRHMVMKNWELFAGLEWQFWDEGSDQKAYNLGTQYSWSNLAVGAEYTKYSDSEVFGIYARYQF